MLSFTLVLMCMSTGFAESMDPADELKACARMTDSDARISCYEMLGNRVLGEDSVDATSEAAPKASAPAALPDNLGGEQFSDEPEPVKKEYRGLVTTCQKGSDGFWYFRFENGQVWKHVNVVRRQYGDCNFYASIIEERMGHKMQIEGDDSRVRVTRIR